MILTYDPALIEQTVSLTASRDPRLEGALHEALDGVYEVSDPELRELRFEGVFADYFTKFGLDKLVPALIAERPLISEKVGKCVVREAGRLKAESAELFVQESSGDATSSHRTLVLQACPHSFHDAGDFVSRMRRELLHVADMLDNRFAFSREEILGLSLRQNLIRDRYRVLWDVHVEGRLHREGRGDEKASKRLRCAFERVFAQHDNRGSCEVFNRIFNAPRLTHPQLMNWARAPEVLFEGATDADLGGRQVPGEQCPLCGFPTCDWFEFEREAGSAVARTIRRYHTNWSPANGACRQCSEMYSTTAATESAVS